MGLGRFAEGSDKLALAMDNGHWGHRMQATYLRRPDGAAHQHVGCLEKRLRW